MFHFYFTCILVVQVAVCVLKECSQVKKFNPIFSPIILFLMNGPCAVVYIMETWSVCSMEERKKLRGYWFPIFALTWGGGEGCGSNNAPELLDVSPFSFLLFRQKLQVQSCRTCRLPRSLCNVHHVARLWHSHRNKSSHFLFTVKLTTKLFKMLIEIKDLNH